MTNQVSHEQRPPFAAYGPTSAGYGPSAAPPASLSPAPWQMTSGSPGRGAPPSPRGPRRGLGITALVVACVGTLSAFGSQTLAWLLLLTAFVLAIVQVSRRGASRVPAVIAFVVIGFGVVIALGAAIILGLTSSSRSIADPVPAPETDTYTLAQRLAIGPGDRVGSSAELSWGTPQTVIDSETGDDVWSIQALAPLDVTSEATEASPGPVSFSGSLVAIPLELTNLTGSTIDPDGWQLRFSTDYYTADGSITDGVYDPALLRDYPSRYDLVEPIAPGETVTFYDVRDIPFSDAGAGRSEVWLYSGDSVSWGATGG
ncbi:MAG: putative metal-binding integral rane protein [Microbacterium sp.]|nr:putative metal-binding integral rane protein [Microbacterium sp.]